MIYKDRLDIYGK